MKLLTNNIAPKRLLAVSLLFFVFISCKKETNSFPAKEENTFSSLSLKPGASTQYNTFKGPEVEVGNGYARSFVTISHTGMPQEFGVSFTDEALSGLPDVNTPYVLDLHIKALGATPFEHIALGWSAHGHPLPGSFMAAHLMYAFL